MGNNKGQNGRNQDLMDNYKKAKDRLRPRSTIFDDGLDKAEKRQQRRLSTKKEIEETLDNELESLEDLEEQDFGLQEYLDKYSI